MILKAVGYDLFLVFPEEDTLSAELYFPDAGGPFSLKGVAF